MASIFLSYAREDRLVAEKLAHVLEGAGHSVWWDRRIEGGSEFAGEIEAALEQADVVVVAWSKESVKSRWVRDEATVGGDKGRLVPVSIDGSLPPMGFRQFHTLDLAGWKAAKRDRRTAELLHSVERRLQGKEDATAARATQSGQRLTAVRRKQLAALAAAVLLAIALGAGYFLMNRGERGGPPAKPTIALLPFTTASADPELRELAAQSRNSLAHAFSQSGLPLRVLDSPSPDTRSAADFLIAGDFSRKQDGVVAALRLDEATHGVTVFSHRFEAAGEESQDLPERIGAQMAGTLTWGAPLRMLDSHRATDPAVLGELLQTIGFHSDPLQQYQVAKRVAAKAPNFASAHVSVAFGTVFVLAALPRAERAEAVTAGRRAAERAISLDPDFGDIYGNWCLLHSETRLAECEDRLRAGRRIDPDAPFLNTFLSHVLRHVGRYEEAVELARLAHTHDPYVPTKIGWMLRSSEFGGDSDAARELFQQGVRWWPEFERQFFHNRLFGLISRGDFDAIGRLEQEVSATKQMPGYHDSSALVSALKSKSVTRARQACPDTADEFLKIRCMLVLAMLGDQNGAYAIADEIYPRRVGRTPAETERIWLDNPDGAGGFEFITSPAAAPMRRDPRYLALAERVGLLAYWRTGRLPDFCRKQPEPICRRLAVPG